MPTFNLSRWVEQRYDKHIEAADALAAAEIAKSMDGSDWGEPESTSYDNIIVFNATGDEVWNEEHDG